MSLELSKDILENLEDAVAKQEASVIIDIFEDMHPEDIADILYELNTPECIYIFNILDQELCSEILATLDEDTRTEFLQNFSPETIARWINFIDSDDAADILRPLPAELRENTLAFVDTEQSGYIIDLLHYEEGSAGSLMAKELIRANVNWTVKQAIEEIRRQAEEVEKFYSLYVVDDHNILLGRVSLKKLILAGDLTLIKDIYVEEEDFIAVKTFQSGIEVADLMQKYDVEAVPVVNSRNELVGRITIDDIMDLITEKAEQDIQMISGISEDVDEDDNIATLTRARLPWLIIGMFGGLLGARFIGFFEADLVALPAMAFFIPLITATGGNVGIQSSSIILQSLANRTFFGQATVWQRLWRVLLVAILNGLVIAVIVFVFAWFLNNNIKLAFTVAIALFSVVVIASVMGTCTPLLLAWLKINPAVASGPFITTANDLIGLAVYFSVARLLY
jgi:magnesium transporter